MNSGGLLLQSSECFLFCLFGPSPGRCSGPVNQTREFPVALVLVINEVQGRFVAGIVIPEYQLAALVLAVVCITDFFGLVLRVNIFSNLQNRSINQEDSCFDHSLF